MDSLLRELVHNVNKDVINMLSNDANRSVMLVLRQSEDMVRFNDRLWSNAGMQEFQDVLLKTQAILDTTWEQLNTGHWSNVPDHLRQVYTYASFLKILAIIQVERCRAGLPNAISAVKASLKTADMGLLLGAPLPLTTGLCLTKVASILSLYLENLESANNTEEKTECHWNTCEDRINSANSSCEDKLERVQGKRIPVLKRPSLETFRLKHFDPKTPVILTDCIGHWPALTHWQDCNYLRRVAGARLVPVELGAKYTDQSWSQKLMTLTEFIDTHVRGVTGVTESTGYLAQHPLFDQVPELLSDIREPEYCCISDSTDDDNEPTAINAWFGPCGTVSPLHHDPKHNILAQVIGSKHLYLYSPEESDHLYPHPDRLLSNTARVDPENPDYEQFPEYRHASAWECTLRAGELIYIPPKWWHHVRSLEVSFSVSFWWK